MTQDKFKDLIEAPAKCAAIGRTVRLTLQYPELAQEYLDNLPKAVNENVPTTRT